MSTHPYRVLAADRLAPEPLAALEAQGFEVHDRAGISPEELKELIPGFHALLIRSRTKVTKDLLEAATELKVIGRAGTGVDNVDLDASTRAGVVVMNVPGGNAVAAAEHTIALMAAMARHIPQAARSLADGEWARSSFGGTELTGKVLGVVGLGRIGREVASRAKGLKMEVLAFDPLLSDEAAEDLGIGLYALEELVTKVDFLTVHVPLSEATRHLVGKDLLMKAKPGLRVLNVARGGIVDESALLEAIEAHHVHGAALDVFEVEPPVTSEGLLARPEVIATPHLGASTREAQEGVAKAVAEQVARFLKDGVIENAVNVAAADRSTQEALAPWLDLSRRLGTAAGRLLGERVRAIEIVLQGQLAAYSREALANAALIGLLKPFAGTSVNAVNARLFAEERGLRVSTRVRNGQHRSFQSVLRVTVKGEDSELSLDGTLFGTSNLRLVRAFDFNLDARLDGCLLLCAHEDRPGMVAHLSRVLAQSEVNIAHMGVGRDPDRGHALSVLNLDATPSAEALTELGGAPGIRWVRCVPAQVMEAPGT